MVEYLIKDDASALEANNSISVALREVILIIIIRELCIVQSSVKVFCPTACLRIKAYTTKSPIIYLLFMP